MCMNELNFEKQSVTHKPTQLQLAITSLCEVKILSSTTVRKFTEFSQILVFKVLPDFLWT
jgi:hypothetical protein